MRTPPIMAGAKFMFDDYIRCMSAKQRLHRRRTSLRHIKLQRIAQLLELPATATTSHVFASSSYMQVGGASPHGFRTRPPGGAVAIVSPVRPFTSPPTAEESSRVSREPAGNELFSADFHEKPSAQSDRGDYHRMAAPESCLHTSQDPGGQARALANVLADEGNDLVTCDTFDALDISDQWKDEEGHEVIEEASDVLDDETWNNFVVDDTLARRTVPTMKCPSAPSTPRGQRRFGDSSTFHLLPELSFGDLTCRNALSAPSLLLEQDSGVEDDSSGNEQQNGDKT